MADKPEIKIKESHKGRFTQYCKSKGYNGVTAECEKEGLASKYGRVRKMAQFSVNAKKFDK